MSRILIVEDEAHLAQGLRFNLEAESHSVEVVDDGERALELMLVNQQSFDVVVLDIMLPGKDGFTVASELRGAQNYIPILMLTARGRPEDVLKGFESGADDYLPKPFDLAILIARIGSLLRRKQWLKGATGSSVAADSDSDIYRFNGNVVDFQRLELRSGDRVYHLTLMESELLRFLIRNAGHPVSRKAILENVWNLREDTDTRAIDNFIVRLRRYIESDSSKPRHLLTVRGLGYEFVANPKL